MKKNWRKYIGKYYPPPTGCLQLVSSVLTNEYGRNLPVNIADRAMEVLRDNLIQVKEEKEGDLILMRDEQWHVGVIIRPGEMLHSSYDGYAIVESYNGLMWKNRVKGFYRWKHDAEDLGK